MLLFLSLVKIFLREVNYSYYSSYVVQCKYVKLIMISYFASLKIYLIIQESGHIRFENDLEKITYFRNSLSSFMYSYVLKLKFTEY